ncbi:uncharacterized protein N7498_006969 [Penicillium cinerascens]|uniref:Rhodopsin domain-containing protein n=1 Tax=Penicillium cinerascens TaxID=70096 RepID=A0A9W9JK33_9EURO|nr:uncharacterized protein N7498_006969 [Penicillium cinerascens]KAJ5197852.1 hypothetical protein N7498_006969 [Penicillium cinerascens]
MESTQPLPHDNISWHIWVGTTTTVFPASLVVALRFTARYVSRAGFWWDDYTILIALGFNLALVAVKWTQIVLWGSGQHVYDLPVETVQNFKKSFMAIEILYFTNAVS